MENPVIIFGAQTLGRSAKEIFELNEVEVYGFLDDDKKLHGKEIDEATVLGATDDDGFLKLIGKKCEAFVAVDDNKLRRSLVQMIQELRHKQPVNAIHNTARISKRASIGHGNLIDGAVIIGPGTTLGGHCVVQSRVTIAPEVTIGDHVQLGAGVIINSGVTVGEEAFIGAGAIIVSGVTIGKGARVGAGSVVIGAVKPGETVFGNPAAPIKA
jgi:sugar O-acyltransferase (sialic acid O-acetyltransferase NeuD family)